MAEPPLIDLIAAAWPNFMKVAPVLRRLEAARTGLRARLVHTGQHYDGTSGVFFRAWGSASRTSRWGWGRARTTSRRHGSCRPLRDPALGDAPAGGGRRGGRRELHDGVHAGRREPPGDGHAVRPAPGERARGARHQRREGIEDARVRYFGNVMIDTLVCELDAARALKMEASLELAPQSYAYVTLHRPSNVDEPEQLRRVADMLRALGERLPVVFPRTRERLQAAGLLSSLCEAPGMRLLEPLGYRESLGFMTEARLVLTDSGGVQEETSYLGIPCLTLRPNTERPVTERLGTNTVIGEDPRRVLPLVEAVARGALQDGAGDPGLGRAGGGADRGGAGRAVRGVRGRYSTDGKPERSELDTNNDHVVDRWETLRADGTAMTVATSRRGTNTPDTWHHVDTDGFVYQTDFDEDGDGKVDRSM